MDNFIDIRGARENNLKNISLRIPKNKLVVLCGVSGSGKSTLAFDTIYAEGQRRFLESLSSYARQFLGQMQKPDVESISGLSPSISIDQKSTNNNPRSTVGTVTEIYDYMRLLWSRVGTPFCPKCGKPIVRNSIENIVSKIMDYEEGTRFIIVAPVVRGEKGTHAKLLENLTRSGYMRVIIDDNEYTLGEDISLDKNKKHIISVVVDRLVMGEGLRTRLNDSLETALRLGDETVIVRTLDEKGSHDEVFSTRFACPTCGMSIEEISPRLFSFNNPYGACPVCGGLGFRQTVSRAEVLRNAHLSIRDGAFGQFGWSFDNSISKMQMKALAKKYDFSLDTPVCDLPEQVVEIILYGNQGEQLTMDYASDNFSGVYQKAYEGIIPNMERRYFTTTSEVVKRELSKYMHDEPCNACFGARLNDKALCIKVAGLNISEASSLSVIEFVDFLDKSERSFDEEKSTIAQPIMKEIRSRINFLIDVGLGYLTLSRSAGSLSGGESQRIRLATQIGSGLTGVIYVLDEPSIGLHQRDNDRLLTTMTKLRDLGNTLIVVEHDEDTLRKADYLIDIGPMAGKGGGEVIATGSVADIIASPRSVTGKYLSGEWKIPVPEVRRVGRGEFGVRCASENNLQNIDVDIKVGVINAISGVSGSGKSSLVNGILYPFLANSLNHANLPLGKCEGYVGVEQFDKVISIDQSPIGRTPRSNPATYTGVFTLIRELFASTPLAKQNGYTLGRFSFNVRGGRCENCEGDGMKKIEMYFLPDVYVECPVCNGKRYNDSTLAVTYKGKNIADVLDMTVEEALEFFGNHYSIRNKLQTLVEVGLGYVRLGQSATTLSGGEAQRVKLATELAKRTTGKTIYLLDEPTTGLHSYDVHQLMKILGRLADAGNTVVLIEHNLDVIKCADYVIDLGPEGGSGGGKVVASGTPEEVAKNVDSWTGKYLVKVL